MQFVNSASTDFVPSMDSNNGNPRDVINDVLSDEKNINNYIEATFNNMNSSLASYQISEILGQDKSRISSPEMISLPQSLLNILDNGDCKTGLFSEISYCWLVHEHSIYMWNYSNPTSEPYIYNSIEEPITAFQLIKANKAIFADTIEYVLAITTEKHIYLYALKFMPDSTIRIVETNFVCSSEGYSIRKFFSSENGRVFFITNNDYYIYELCCQLNSGLRNIFTSFSYMHIENRTIYTITKLIPAYFNSSNFGVYINHICYDKKTGLICYTTTNQALYVYSLGTKRSEFNLLGSISNIKEACATFYANSPEYNQLFRTDISDNNIYSDIADLCVYDRSIKDIGYSFVAITKAGIRLFILAHQTNTSINNNNNNNNFISKSSLYSNDKTPVTISFIRLPPNINSYQQSHMNQINGYSIPSSINGSTTINTITISRPQDLRGFPSFLSSPVCIYGDWTIYRMNEQNTNINTLLLINESLDSGIWHQSVFIINFNSSISTIQCGTNNISSLISTYSDYHSCYTILDQYIYILSNRFIYKYTIYSLSHLLKNIIFSNNNNAVIKSTVDEMLSIYNNIEIYSLFFHIFSTATDSIANYTFKYFILPEILSSPDVIIKALTKYYYRIVSSIFTVPLFVLTKDTNTIADIDITISKEDIEMMTNCLSSILNRVKQFMNINLYTISPVLLSLFDIINRTKEILSLASFVYTFSSYHPRNTKTIIPVSSMDTVVLASLFDKNNNDFYNIQFIINILFKESDTEVAVDATIETVSELCSSYYNNSNKIYHKLLYLAQNTNRQQGIEPLRPLLCNGIQLWSQNINNLSIYSSSLLHAHPTDYVYMYRNIRDIAIALSTHVNIRELVEYALLCVYYIYKENTTSVPPEYTAYLKDPSNVINNSEVSERLSLYLYIYTEIENRLLKKQVIPSDSPYDASVLDFLNEICHSTDHFFHLVLYESIYANDSYNIYLYAINSLFIVDYLSMKNSDCLYQYYMYHKQYINAAQICATIASKEYIINEGFNENERNMLIRKRRLLTVQKRIEYIDNALHAYRCANIYESTPEYSDILQALAIQKQVFAVQISMLQVLTSKEEYKRQRTYLVDIDTLSYSIMNYNNLLQIGQKYNLYECILDICILANIQDETVITTQYANIFNTFIDDYHGSTIWVDLSNLLSAIIGKYNKKETSFIFPLRYILSYFYTIIKELSDSANPCPTTWLIHTFIDNHVDYEKLFNTLIDIMNTNEDIDNHNSILYTYLEDIYTLIELWYNHVVNSLFPNGDTSVSSFLLFIPIMDSHIQNFIRILNTLPSDTQLTPKFKTLSISYEKLSSELRNYMNSKQVLYSMKGNKNIF